MDEAEILARREQISAQINQISAEIVKLNEKSLNMLQ